LQDEYRRMNHIIRLDHGAAVLLCVGVASVGMYTVPFLSAVLQFACWAVTAAAIVVIQLYERHKISRPQLMRDDAATQLNGRASSVSAQAPLALPASVATIPMGSIPNAEPITEIVKGAIAGNPAIRRLETPPCSKTGGCTKLTTCAKRSRVQYTRTGS
jgi:hypothetical protein